MATKKPQVVHVAVCGLTSSGRLSGSGKSSLCNRFVQPSSDSLCLHHSSIMSCTQFGFSPVNSTHFLYWGEKICALEDGCVTLQIIEHTEFVNSENLQPHPFSKPYHKRCTQQKLVSLGKVQYLHPEQLGTPEKYVNVEKFPQKFVVDGYIVCIDVSDNLHDPQSQQREFLSRLLPAIMSIKKARVVVALTKFDAAKEASIHAANEILSKCKRQLTVIEVSALQGVNVDVCFLVLAHLVDSKRPRTRILPYSVAYAHLNERVRKNEESFQTVVSSRITDCSLSLKTALSLVENEVEFLILRELKGINHVQHLVKSHLSYLKEVRIKTKIGDFLNHLQESLPLFMHEISLSDTLNTCKEKIRNHEKYQMYFTENPYWKEDFTILNEDHVRRVPFSILDEPEGVKVLQQHMDTIPGPLREDVACKDIFNTLKSTQNLIPGSGMEEVLHQLGLANHLAAVPKEKALLIFQERMAQVEQECVSDLTELLLEHPDLLSLPEETALSAIDAELKDDPRYQRLSHCSALRTSAIIKHIALITWPDKGRFALSPILESYSLRDHGALSQEELSRRQGGQSAKSNWTLSVDSSLFKLAVLGRTNANALTLHSDFMNYLSGSGMCEVDGRSYKMELSVYHGKIAALHTRDFSPQGAVAVVNSKECLIWLEETLQTLWIPDSDTSPPYQGLPLVILALDDSITHSDVSSMTIPASLFCQRAKLLAGRVQCVLMIERPTTQPKCLVDVPVVSSLVSSILNSVTSYAEFLQYDLQYKPKALNVAVFTLAGDQYTPRHILLPWLCHQAVCCDNKGSSLFINCAIERQHCVANLTFHSSLNILDVKRRSFTGFIVAYSPHRLASSALMKHLLSQLPNIPMLIVAMVTESRDDNVTEEGQNLAQQHGAFFIASDSREWGIGYTSDFFTKCWFSRFSSWQTQNNLKDSIPCPLPQLRDIKEHELDAARDSPSTTTKSRDEDNMYAVVDRSQSKKKTVAPPVLPRFRLSPIHTLKGKDSPELSQRSLEHQKKSAKPLPESGTSRVQQKSSDMSVGSDAKAHKHVQPHQTAEAMYALPLKKTKKTLTEASVYDTLDTVIATRKSFSHVSTREDVPEQSPGRVPSLDPVLPERRYSSSEMGLEDGPPPLPPRNYTWSDVEDDDEDLFDSNDDLQDPSSTAHVSLDDMYSSLKKAQQSTTMSPSSIEEIYAIVNRVAKRQESTTHDQPQPAANNEEDRKIYEEAMTKGYIESALTILILVGVMGSGKSLFKRLVLGLSVPEFSPSTPLAESAVRSMSICQVSVGGEGSLEWRIVTPSDMIDIVADSIKKGVPVLDLSWEDIGQLAFTSSTDFGTVDATSSEVMEVTKQQQQEKPFDTLASDPLPEPEHDSTEVQQEVEPQDKNASTPFSTEFLDALQGINVDQQLIQKMSATSSGGKKLMDINFVYILDSGGQPPFREMLPHFVQQSSAFVLMQKLNETLDFKPPIKYREEGKEESIQYISQLTNEQILHQYFQAVQSHDSSVFVIGTHRDLQHKCEAESWEVKNQRLLEAFRPVLGSRIVLYRAGDPDQLMFPVDCTSRKPEDLATAQAFREAVTKLCLGKKVKIPLPWFVLEQMLRQLAEKMKEKVLNIEECYEVAYKKLGIHSNACNAAIEFLGKLNILFYRPSVLPKVVFCDAQVILDKITELVRCSHELKSNTTQSLPQNRQSGEWLDFRDFAQIDSKILGEFPSHYRDGLFTVPEFLELLEDLLITGRLKNGKYFMPSLLPDLSAEEVTKYRVASQKQPAPMTIYYPQIWLPVGVVPALVVYLQNHCNWTPVVRGGKPACMYHNCMQFQLPGGKAGSVALIDSTKFLEMHVKAPLRVASKVCPAIRAMVLSGLKEAHKSLHYDSAVVEDGVLCSGECGNKEAHLATLDEDRESWKCSEDADTGDDLDKGRQAIWFVPLEDMAIGQVKLNLRTLQMLPCHRGEEIRVMDQVAAKWEALAIALSFDEASIAIIQRDSLHRSETACLNMLQRWLMGEARMPICWGVFLDALKEGKFEKLALELAMALRQPRH